MVTPAHLCQLKSLSRVSENGRSAMYQPTEKVPMIAIASTQWNSIATPS